MLRTKCSACDTEVKLIRSSYNPTILEGTCPKCGKREKRWSYKCTNCDDYTIHRYSRAKKDKIIFQCEMCGNEKIVYVGLRKSPQRSMM